MTTFNITDNIVIKASVYENSRNWGHKAEVYVDNELLFKRYIRYINRTWEEWQFQSLLQHVAESKKLTEKQRLAVKLYLLHIEEGTEVRPF